MVKPNRNLIAACEACVVHGRDLFESAKLVQASERANIAYHLATWALEEIGRRELFQINDVASNVGEMPPWQMNATQDHVQKLFWCFYGVGRVQDVIDQKQFFEKREAAADIHTIRLSGLYVEKADAGLNIPSKAISMKQSSVLRSKSQEGMEGVDTAEQE